MLTILLSIDTETAVDDLPGIEVLSESADGVVDVALDDASDLLEMIDPATIEVAVGVSHPDWEQGNPCPECGETGLSVSETEESIYDSAEGDFQYVSGGDATGGILSVLCPNCMTSLEHVPIEGLYR
ncbi:MAG: hypothetical protein ACI8XM_000012 [Haloarculaceae archaeon]|jgi:hypothetical protein